MENNDIDKNVDVEIYDCITASNPKSFFLFAGAGSGKTRTLVNVLTQFKENHGNEFKLKNKKIAIITFTNAAADEISHRLAYDGIFSVSTIHSFCWDLIQNFTIDIKEFLVVDLKKSITELNVQLSKSRDPNNKTSVSNKRKIESKTKRLELFPKISKFIYNPNGDNLTKDSLNHTEVISIASHFIASKKLFQQILANKYPIVLIDESQDTNKHLIDALFSLQLINADKISLGLFGDTMQRIYSDGKEKLGEKLPPDWLTPAKQMNHRSKSRIIELINKIRKDIDGQHQIPRIEKSGGVVRFFIVKRGIDKPSSEESIKEKMSSITKDITWIDKSNPKDKINIPVKTLILEHHMAAARIGFSTFFRPLYAVDKMKTGLLDGSSASINFFIKIILPLVLAYKSNNNFEIANIVKKHSPLFDKRNIEKESDIFILLKTAKTSTDKLLKLWNEDKSPTLLEILNNINESKLFNLPSDLKLSIERSTITNIEDGNEELKDNESLLAWDAALNANFNEIIKYNEYISENSGFGTHQGVKGLEYDRVMVIIDDDEANGFMFSYDKLFGIKSLTTGDKKNIGEGKETGIDRTSRLFYVACSRAKESLAIVAYTDDTIALKNNLLKFGWFKEEEIEILP
ncbi:DNA helicase-2/ATP-dependent DNA helicase PcrA [Flavobacterium sp. 28A]|uniref:UvrD-helicase domain-containing protein n=1 Tax=Flavobacterium sp. 28A TaxID=2735895 RepID=UPI00156F85C0|nr:UvrD-helicase domain-containing protein [Flavobacterium sp. 28A]NRT15516.1 DNA helicase-2/ATP-dependent DNA helicase PcrA [Flavobacterium sp. 28A]